MNCTFQTKKLTQEQWVQQRKKGLGGSDAGAVLGVSKYETPFSLWAKKRGIVEDTFEGNSATALGQAMERPILEDLAKTENLAIVTCKQSAISKTHYWQAGNFDAFLVEPSDQFPAGSVTNWQGEEFPVEPLAIIEVKTANLLGRGNQDAWFSERGCPESYYWQMVHYCAVTGLRKTIMVALVGGQGILVRDYDVPEEDVVFLTETEADFWNKVEDGIEPELTGLEPDMDTLKSIYPTHEEGKVASFNEFQADLVNEYIEAKIALDQAQERLDRTRAELMNVIADAESAEYEGRTLLTYKQTKGSERFDAKAFKEAQPDIYKQYTKQTAGFRVLRLKGE